MYRNKNQSQAGKVAILIPAENIRRLRLQRGLSQRQLADRLGVKNPTIARWESGKVDCSDEWRERLAKALEVPLQALMPAAGEVDAPQPIITKKMPLYGSVPAGHRDTWPLPDESFDVLAGLWRSERFALRIQGDSMAEELRDGDIVVVDPMHPVALSPVPQGSVDQARTKGPVYVVRLNGDPTVKRVGVVQKSPKMGSGSFVIALIGSNPSVAPRYVSEGDVLEFVGRVMAVAWRSL